MTQRGRSSQSAEDIKASGLSVVPVTLRERPAPPDDFEEGYYEHELWMQIVEENPVDWFRDGDLPMLEAYVRAASNHRRASAEAADADFVVNTVQGVKANPIFGVVGALAATMASLAVKLRISHSARLAPSKARTLLEREAGKTAATGTNDGTPKRPWET